MDVYDLTHHEGWIRGGIEQDKAEGTTLRGDQDLVLRAHPRAFAPSIPTVSHSFEKET